MARWASAWSSPVKVANSAGHWICETPSSSACSRAGAVAIDPIEPMVRAPARGLRSWRLMEPTLSWLRRGRRDGGPLASAVDARDDFVALAEELETAVAQHHQLVDGRQDAGAV